MFVLTNSSGKGRSHNTRWLVSQSVLSLIACSPPYSKNRARGSTLNLRLPTTNCRIKTRSVITCRVSFRNNAINSHGNSLLRSLRTEVGRKLQIISRSRWRETLAPMFRLLRQPISIKFYVLPGSRFIRDFKYSYVTIREKAVKSAVQLASPFP